MTDLQKGDLSSAWPNLICDHDPYAGDERLPAVVDLDRLEEFGSKPVSPQGIARLQQAINDVLTGAIPLSHFEEVAGELGLAGPLRHDPRPAVAAESRVPDAEIADIVEDWVPDIGLVGPDRVLGPFADGSLPRPLRCAAAAVLTFSPIIHPRVRAIDRARRIKKPRLDRPFRTSLAAISRCPPSIWYFNNHTWCSVLPLAQGFLPDGPMDAPHPIVFGRAVPGPQGWWVATPIPLPAVPPASMLLSRMRVEVVRERLRDPRVTFEDVLRDRGEVLMRTVAEWCDLQGLDLREITKRLG